MSDYLQFAEGDRVQVVDDCPEVWRGATGFVVDLPSDDSGDLGTGSYLIEFDEPVSNPATHDEYTGAFIAPAYLRRA
jgi:hypothetical protein